VGSFKSPRNVSIRCDWAHPGFDRRYFTQQFRAYRIGLHHFSWQGPLFWQLLGDPAIVVPKQFARTLSSTRTTKSFIFWLVEHARLSTYVSSPERGCDNRLIKSYESALVSNLGQASPKAAVHRLFHPSTICHI